MPEHAAGRLPVFNSDIAVKVDIRMMGVFNKAQGVNAGG